MYDGSFGLKRRPFNSVPQVENYFAASAIENARTTLVRCIQRGEGVGLVIGPSGTGKTLLCLMLAEQFRRSFEVVMLAGGGLTTRRALFQAILYELGRPFRGLDEGEARLAVVDCLMNEEETSRGIVMLVDEAHTLPLRLLEEIRLLTNVIRNGQPMVRLVLLGGPVLEERFASPKLDSFSQRISARCYLEALNRTETQEYIVAQIKAAGGNGEKIFPPETCQSVFQATGGVPRLINQVCDHAMLLAYIAGKRKIDVAVVEEAWADLQQLPTPWNNEAKHEPAAGGIIEFGSLDDQFDSTQGEFSKAVPALKISPVDEEQEGDQIKPDEQIHRIERLLAEADEEFQPAGSIGPEVELKFGVVSEHPFQEEFQHEEVVADRYAATSVANLATVCETEELAPLKSMSSFEVEPKSEVSPVDKEKPLETSKSAAEPVTSGMPQDVSKVQKGITSQSASRREYRRLFASLKKG